jgi:hypothetical protein
LVLPPSADFRRGRRRHNPAIFAAAADLLPGTRQNFLTPLVGGPKQLFEF